MRDYACFETEGLAASIKKIEKRLGFDKCKKALDACNSGDIEQSARICLDYYDSAYGNQLDTRIGDRQSLPSVIMDSLEGENILEDLKSLSEKIVFN